MNTLVSRRSFFGAVGGGAAVLAAGPASGLPAEAPKLAIDRSGADWGNRPMYLRPYHPTYLVCYYARRFESKAPASSLKWDSLVARVENEPDLEIHLVECFDDACAGCGKLTPDRFGCLWGVGYTCTSVEKPDTVEMVIEGNKRILSQLDLFFGSRILMRDLVLLLEERIPVLHDIIGGAGNQANYEKGLDELKRKYGL